jgi:hypothetical protein
MAQQLSAVLLATLRLVYDGGSGYVSFSAAIAATGAALTLSARQGDIGASYGLAAELLNSRVEEFETISSEDDLEEMVRDVEAIVTNEVGEWVGRSV